MCPPSSTLALTEKLFRTHLPERIENIVSRSMSMRKEVMEIQLAVDFTTKQIKETLSNIENEISAKRDALSDCYKALINLQMAEVCKSSSESSVNKLSEEMERLKGILQTFSLLPYDASANLHECNNEYEEKQLRAELLLQSQIESRT